MFRWFRPKADPRTNPEPDDSHEKAQAALSSLEEAVKVAQETSQRLRSTTSQALSSVEIRKAVEEEEERRSEEKEQAGQVIPLLRMAKGGA